MPSNVLGSIFATVLCRFSAERSASTLSESWLGMQADERDGIRISRQPCGPRDVTVSTSCPAELQRTGPW